MTKPEPRVEVARPFRATRALAAAKQNFGEIARAIFLKFYGVTARARVAFLSFHHDPSKCTAFPSTTKSPHLNSLNLNSPT
jgi:hypothetical protein